MLQDNAAAQLLPLVGKGGGDTFTELTARGQQQRCLFPLLVDVARGIPGFIFWRQGEVADVWTVLHLLGLVQRQHVQRGITFHQLFDVTFQQRANHDTGSVLLNLSQQLAQRLRAGVIHLQLGSRVSGNG
ncbi:hypothetical protein D3C75_242530 [compost metagenome]